MVKHTKTIRLNCLSVFDHSVKLALKGLSSSVERLPLISPGYFDIRVDLFHGQLSEPEKGFLFPLYKSYGKIFILK